MIKRIIALTLIFACSWYAWHFLSEVMNSRTAEKSSAMTDAVGGLWGTAHTQFAPAIVSEWPGETVRPVPGAGYSEVVKEIYSTALTPDANDIRVKLDLDYRKKGLVWFSTYTADFAADYAISNKKDIPVKCSFTFPLPSTQAVYGNLIINAPQNLDLSYYVKDNKILGNFKMEPGQAATIGVSYQARGLDQWTYRFGEKTDMVKKFKLVMTTDFDEIDFPRDSISPDNKEQLPEGGWQLTWEKESLISAFQIGMVMPRRIDPGPLASIMSSHAPVSLLFFFFVLFLMQVFRGIKMHPMNYFFIAAGFFSFNLLFAYLVDHLDITVSFLISSAVSIVMVVSYLRLVVGTKFALLDAGLSQFFYQILFAFAHFFTGYTGLCITVGAILTLALVMQMTAKLDWEKIFRDQDWGRLKRQKDQEPNAIEILE